jgi:hypothetical protein
MVIQPNVSRWPWMLVTNTLVCSTEANVGVVTQWVNMVNDQTLNVI